MNKTVNILTFTEEQLLSLVRQSYLAGGDDKDGDCFQWCIQGSKERAEEILQWYLEEENIL